MAQGNNLKVELGEKEASGKCDCGQNIQQRLEAEAMEAGSRGDGDGLSFWVLDVIPSPLLGGAKLVRGGAKHIPALF